MAEASKTAKKSLGKNVVAKRLCTSCKTGETQVVKYAGYGPLRGFRWTCIGLEGKNACGFTEATRGE